MNFIDNANKLIEEKSQEPMKLRPPLIIVVIFAILALVPTVLNIFIIMCQVYNNMWVANILMLVITFLIGILSFVFLWLLLSGIFYLSSSMFYPVGTFKKMIEMTGYGFIPLIFYQIVYMVAALSIIHNIHVESTDLTYLMSYIGEVRDSVPFTSFLIPVNIICLVASTYIWVMSVKTVRKIPVISAVIAVGVPIIGYFAYLLQNM